MYLEVAVSLVLALVAVVLFLFEVLLLARAAFDWTAVLAGPAMPGTIRSRVSGGVYAVTEPVLGPVRRMIPPVRLGRFSVDIAFMVVFIGVILLRQALRHVAA
jgi:YggT family protein